MKRTIDILEHMLTDIQDIERFTKGLSFTGFTENILVRKAVCMSLINIGELSKSLSREFKAANSSIPWRNIAGLRDVTAHKYHTLNLEIIWQVVTLDIPRLKMFIEQKLSSL